MWGFGGRYYWGSRTRKPQGIVVVFAWMSSQQRHLNNYTHLYASLGWNSLVCHSQFLNSFFPEKAVSLALEILDELVEELKKTPVPVVFASFSGGPKACMYKVLQVIQGTCEKQQQNMVCISYFPPSLLRTKVLSYTSILTKKIVLCVTSYSYVVLLYKSRLFLSTMFVKHKYHVVRDCVAGHIYDSSPVDFTSDLGSRFVLHPSILGMSRPPRFAQSIANGIASSLDGLFLNRFETQRADYWQTLYSSVSFNAPYLIMCSEDDDLAPCQTICNFAQRLQELGADVSLVKWTSSPHVGHYRQHPIDYKGAVTELLQKVSLLFSKRTQKLSGEKMGIEGGRDELSEPQGELRAATATSLNDIFNRVSAEMGRGHSFVPSSFEYHQEGKAAVGSFQDEPKAGLVHIPAPPRINASGVLGQILFDACVPQNVEEWDVGHPSSSARLQFSSSRLHGIHLNPIKCIMRSRL